MEWIYLSPHLDDVALSCGGLIWEQVQWGDRVSIWTITAGDPNQGVLSPFAESLHARWEIEAQSYETRRQEDLASCAILGASPRHFSLPDCIYRHSPLDNRHLYASEESLFGPLDLDEAELIMTLTEDLEKNLPGNAELICPLALGHHVDHQLTRAAVEKLGRELWYYADYPYILHNPNSLEEMRQAGWKPILFKVSPAGLEAWKQAVAAHQSQISTFWPNKATMYTTIEDYFGRMGGIQLWRPCTMLALRSDLC
jgi:LmbE family N-acetylglucosaminyl deacetylase